jgi:hypothetical protein
MGLVGCLTCVALPAFAATTGWQPYAKVSDNYFEGAGTTANIVLVLADNFNSCGADNTGQISLSVVGSDQYQALAQAALVAISEGRTLSLQISGCTSGRAVITGLRLGD